MPVICQLRLSMHAPCIQQLLHGPGFPNVMPCNRVTLRARHATLRDIRGCCCIIRMHASSGFKQRGTYHVMRPCSPVVTFPRVYHFCYLGHYFPRQIDWIAGSAGPGSAVCQDPKIGTSRGIPALYHFCYLGHYFSATHRLDCRFSRARLGLFARIRNRHISGNSGCPKSGNRHISRVRK